MPLTVPCEGELLLLSYILKVAGKVQPSVILRLYKTDTSITDQVSGSQLVEADQASYAPVTCSFWSVSIISSSIATASNSEVTFNFYTNASLYGYMFSDGATLSGNLMWIERFSGAPFNLPTGGGTISITPKITCE